MIITEQGAWWETLLGTEPSRKRLAPVIPLFPSSTMRTWCPGRGRGEGGLQFSYQRRLLNELALFQVQDAVGAAGGAGIVRDHQDRFLQRFAHGHQQVEDQIGRA